MISQILGNPDARMFFSFLIGLGVTVLLFHRPQPVTNYTAVPADELTEKVVRMDGKCYRFVMEDATCKTEEFS